MKKNDLIEFLQSIDGNPDIVTWDSELESYEAIRPMLQELFLTKGGHLIDQPVVLDLTSDECGESLESAGDCLII